MRSARHTKASIELNRILDEDGSMAKAIRAKFTRSAISRWRHAIRKPDVKSTWLLNQLTRGRVSAADWFIAAEPEICKTCGRA